MRHHKYIRSIAVAFFAALLCLQFSQAAVCADSDEYATLIKKAETLLDVFRGGKAEFELGHVDLFLRTLDLAGSFLDRPVDVVLGHIDRPGCGYSGPQTGIGIGVTAAHSGSDHDLLGKFGEHLATLGILCAFAVFGVCPF